MLEKLEGAIRNGKSYKLQATLDTRLSDRTNLVSLLCNKYCNIYIFAQEKLKIKEICLWWLASFSNCQLFCKKSHLS